MVFTNRNYILILCLSVVFIGVSVAVKINKQFSSSRHVPSSITTASQLALSSELDQSFLENSAQKNTKNELVTEKPKPIGVRGVTAVAYLVGNIKTGKIYLEKNSRRVMPVASMSKLVTAFVATDMFSGTSTITITEQALSAPPDESNLKAGENYTLSEILQPLLLASSNVAAEAISSSSPSINYLAFMELMRNYAWEVGMPHSFFADPSGVSPKNIASAEDLFGLAKYLVDYRPDILVLTRVASTSIATTTEHGSHQFSNTHPFVNDPRFIGGKTGRTPEAGETMMTLLQITDQPIVFVILGARYGARENDTRILLGKIEGMIGP